MSKEVKEFILLSSCLVVVFLGTFFVMLNQNHATEMTDEEEVVDESGLTTGEFLEEVEEIEEEVFAPESFNGLLVGFDKSLGLTDVLMVANFNATTNEVKIISVPRDLHIDFREEPFATIKKEDPNNHIGYCKITEIYNNLDRTPDALKQLEKVVSEIVGLEIDYMATIDVSAFREVVDAVGGVEFYVPQRMYYVDRYQDLYIDLDEGLQLMDGDKAEQLVRFRKYTLGDIQRIQVQQDFMVELYKKVMEIRDLDQLVGLATTVYGLFQADFGLNFGLDYAQYFFELDKSDLLNSENMTTLPSWGEQIDEIWYQKWDMEEMHITVKELLSK
ncbi:MAG: LCP family protein [Vallitaleaceae bacterium]|nr:LCP family protein [Vallitaleaceae bacterium]